MNELFQYTFFQYALIGLAIISIASAMIGTYIVTRRMVSISGGVTHACFGGLGLGYYLGWNPVLTAALFAVASSLGVELMSVRGRVREDSAIAVIWAIGMAVGILFVFLTPGYVPELNSFLFGNVLTISRADLWAFALFTAVLALFFALFYRRIVAVAFDRDFAFVIGLPVGTISTVMTVMTAVCIVLTIRLVGIMLLMSMLALPQLTAELFCRRFSRMMLASAAVSLLCSVGGLMLAAVVDVPCSALIVLVMASVYVLTALGVYVAKRVRMRSCDQ
ncbi:metal ABC transporter permease [Paramuribaculum intestinale]|uniref:metal ABC transporter permease n=1 Tax=Paramuribaculum intestinale TaxID=2094151 RepID=UPI000FFF16FB|nr:metal ABC transporter permease [Paramuribaculum intestinale]RXE62465.1 metal ABC transporter permease [Muribaculaceae bacterium Isolate-004 (NCI)]